MIYDINKKIDIKIDMFIKELITIKIIKISSDLHYVGIIMDNFTNVYNSTHPSTLRFKKNMIVKFNTTHITLNNKDFYCFTSFSV